MIIYEAQISEFLDDVANKVIVDRFYKEKIGRISKDSRERSK